VPASHRSHAPPVRCGSRLAYNGDILTCSKHLLQRINDKQVLDNHLSIAIKLKPEGGRVAVSVTAGLEHSQGVPWRMT